MFQSCTVWSGLESATTTIGVDVRMTSVLLCWVGPGDGEEKLAAGHGCARFEPGGMGVAHFWFGHLKLGIYCGL